MNNDNFIYSIHKGNIYYKKTTNEIITIAKLYLDINNRDLIILEKLNNSALTNNHYLKEVADLILKNV